MNEVEFYYLNCRDTLDTKIIKKFKWHHRLFKLNKRFTKGYIKGVETALQSLKKEYKLYEKSIKKNNDFN